MTLVHGFELILERDIPEIASMARLWRHRRTGARLLSMVNDDENKVFGVAFRTPPKDSTGVAHILEHSVLCGSKRYPVKEPFVELLKGSLQTFLNAMTYPDKTVYPVASCNLQDFRNLVDVYIDAVLHPRITEDIFRQEGWHLEPKDPADPRGDMIFKGVVYNEMKGAYSAPDGLLLEYTQQALFPDNAYGLDSGGDPARIPELTHQDFFDFHRRYYHPSNAWFFYHGDDPEEARLERIDQALEGYDALEVDSAVAPQPRLATPVSVDKGFVADEPDEPAEEGEDGEDASRRGMLTLSWLLPETVDPEINLALHILDLALVGLPGAPLRKALIDSGLGEDLAGVGLESELRQMYFSTGLKGMDPEQAQAVEDLILDALRDLVETGLPSDLVEAAVNSLEFGLRENNTGHFPRGLSLYLRSLTTWLYDADPLALLAFDAPLEAVKARLASGEKLLESLIREHLLDNPHRARVLLRPDPTLAERMEAEEQGRLDAMLANLGPDERQALAEDAARLTAMQQAHDRPEDLATIPRLGRGDLRREHQTAPLAEETILDRPLLLHDIETNGVAYLDLGFDLNGLPEDLLPLAPLFGRCLTDMGTESESYVDLSLRIARQTGGVDVDPFLSTSRLDGRALSMLLVRGKATTANAPRLLDILRDILLAARLDDRERFKQLVLEDKAQLEQRLIPAGHRFVAGRLRARFSEEGWIAERMDGVEQLFFLRKLAREVDQDWPSVEARLRQLREMILGRDRLLVNVTQDEKGYAAWAPGLLELVDSLPASASPDDALEREDPDAPFLPAQEGLAIPAQVNYVGKAVNLFQTGWKYRGQALVVTKHLRASWLWDQVRVQGGAYGAFCSLDRLSGVLSFTSYRDPNLERTLDIFNRSGDYLRNLDLSPEALDASVVGGVGEIDPHMLPDAKGFVSMARWLRGDTPEVLQEIRDQVLSVTPQDFKDFAEACDEAARSGDVAVMGSRQALERAAKSPGLEGMNITRVL